MLCQVTNVFVRRVAVNTRSLICEIVLGIIMRKTPEPSIERHQTRALEPRVRCNYLGQVSVARSHVCIASWVASVFISEVIKKCRCHSQWFRRLMWTPNVRRYPSLALMDGRKEGDGSWSNLHVAEKVGLSIAIYLNAVYDELKMHFSQRNWFNSAHRFFSRQQKLFIITVAIVTYKLINAH